MENIIYITLLVILSYLIGSIPSALIVSRLFFGFDIRTKGSGNMGSTNVFRTLGFKWGLLVQIADIMKGIVPVVFIASIFSDNVDFGMSIAENTVILKFIAGAAAVCGHIWTIFAGFRGGKGINTAAGMLAAIAPIDFTAAIIVFIIVFLISAYVSLSSMIAATAFPLSMLIRRSILGQEITAYGILINFAAILSLLLIFTHRTNIVRLAKGTENKVTKYQLFKSNNKKNQ